jgi:hypothetical protein
MDLDWDEGDAEIESESPFRTALAAGRVDEAGSADRAARRRP